MPNRAKRAAPDRGRRGTLIALAGAMLLPAAGRGQTLREGEPPPYVPTPALVVQRMLALAKVRPEDFVIDLGSGDGRIVIAAAKQFGARAMGVELHPALVEKSRVAARAASVEDRTRFVAGDALRADLSQATVLTLYLGPELNAQLANRILDTMRPGARVVSHDFGIASWQPDATESFFVQEKNHGNGADSTVLLWIVPANAAGRWRCELGDGTTRRVEEFSIAQNYQEIEGAIHRGSAQVNFKSARLSGTDIAFDATLQDGEQLQVRATIVAAAMKGTATSTRGAARTPLRFEAKRIAERGDLR